MAGRSQSHSRSASQRMTNTRNYNEESINAQPVSAVAASIELSLSSLNDSESDDSELEESLTQPAPVQSVRQRSVGSLVAGLVGRAPPRSAPIDLDGDDGILEEDDDLDLGDEESTAAADAPDDDPVPKNSPTFNAPAHAASRTHCPTCTRPFDLVNHLPILLHPGHNFCSWCMDHSNELAAVGSTVTCPLCKLVVHVPDDNGSKQSSVPWLAQQLRHAPLDESTHTTINSKVTSGNKADNSSASSKIPPGESPFPINYLIRDQLELLEFRRRIERQEVLCIRCDDTATTICMTCDTFLCAFHKDDHLRSKETKTHPLKSFEEFLLETSTSTSNASEDESDTLRPSSSSSTSTSSSFQQRNYCYLHPDTELELWCLECSVPICIRCTLPSGGSSHCSTSGIQHVVEPLSQHTTKMLRRFHEMNHFAKTKYTKLIRGILEIQKVGEKIQSRKEKVMGQIETSFEMLHQQLEQRKEQLLSKLNDLVDSKNYSLNIQNQILYIVARSIEDATLELDAMLESVATPSSAELFEDGAYSSSKDPRTNHGPDHPIAPGPGGRTTRHQTQTATATATPLPTSVSRPAKMLRLSSHVLTTLEGLLQFQPAALQPEESAQFAFRMGTMLQPMNASPRGKGHVHTSSKDQLDLDDDVGIDDRLIHLISKVGSVSDSMSNPNLCTAMGDGLTSTFVRTESTFQIQARNRYGQNKKKGGDPFVVEFIGPTNSAHGRIVDHGNGMYTVRYIVLTPGHYSIVVSIHGRHIQGSPFRIHVHGSKDMTMTTSSDSMTDHQYGTQHWCTVGTRGLTSGQLLNPMGLAVGNGTISNDQQLLHTQSSITDASPYSSSSSLSTGLLYVCDYGNNRLSVYRLSSGGSPSPTFVRTIGGKLTSGSSEHGSFKGPWGIAIDPLTDNIFVTDTNNHRIQVFTSQGDWLKSWGSVGSIHGKFRNPAGIVIYTPTTTTTALSSSSSSTQRTHDSNNEHGNDLASMLTPMEQPDLNSTAASSHQTPARPSPSAASSYLTPGVGTSSSSSHGASSTGQLVFVADREKHRIQVFDIDGRFIRSFGTSGSGPGQLLHPSGLALDPSQQHLYVCDFSNHRIQVFTFEGSFVTMWGSRGTQVGQFLEPVGITTDRYGKIYVADQNNHRIQVFTREGTFIRLLGSQGTTILKGEKNTFLKPSALIVASIKTDGTVLHPHEADGGDRTNNDDTNQQGGVPVPDSHSTIATTLVIVSDAANHRLQLFK